MKKMLNDKRVTSLLVTILTPFLLCVSQPLFAKEHFNYHHCTLKNGLEVVILPNNRAPVVYHALWYRAGFADSPTNLSGIAHFLEHMMFKGSKNYPGDTFKRVLNNLGGSQNATTTWDRTGFFVTIAKDYLPTVMEMEADRMQNLSILPDDVEKEREVVLQERRSVTDSQDMQLVSEAANASFFWQHPYGKPIIGFEEHIRRYTPEAVREFYQTWYRPSNAILVIAGDVQVEALMPQIEKYYGQIPHQAPTPRKRAEEPTHRGTTAKVEIRSPQVSSFFERIYRAPNHRTASLHKEAVLILLQDILGDPNYGRLSQNLVQNQKMAHFISVGYIGAFYDPYSFTIAAAPTNPSDLPLLEASVEASIRRLIMEGVNEEELNKAKEQRKFEYLYLHDSLHGIADYFGEHMALGYSIQDLENWLDVLEAVKKEEIQEAAKEVLGVHPEVTVYTDHVAQK